MSRQPIRTALGAATLMLLSACAAVGSGPKDPFGPGLHVLSRQEFETALVGAELHTLYPGAAPSEPETEAYYPGGGYRRRFGALAVTGSYSFRRGVVCVDDVARGAGRRCSLLLGDDKGGFFRRNARSRRDQVGEGPLGRLQVVGDALREG